MRNRIQRRQTGNDDAYLDLCNLVREWRVFPDTKDSWQDETINGLVAFPTGDFFLERVFEIWLIQQVAGALELLGADRVAGPQSLQLRSEKPIYQYQFGGQNIDIWFQRSLPKESATWRYQHTGQFLSGIPDLMLIGD